MRLPLRTSLAVAATTVAALMTAAVPAAAVEAKPLINRTDCNQNDYLEVHNNNGRDTLCFANAGHMPVAIYGVNWVESGNNNVTLEFQRNLSNPVIETTYLSKWNAWRPTQAIHKIISIRIH